MMPSMQVDDRWNDGVVEGKHFVTGQPYSKHKTYGYQKKRRFKRERLMLVSNEKQ